MIKVILNGRGGIGQKIARNLVEKENIEIVGAVHYQVLDNLTPDEVYFGTPHSLGTAA